VIESRAGTDIEAPMERVFDYVADARNEPNWLPGARTVEKVTPGAVGLATRFDGTYARAGRVSIELVAFERPSRLTFRARSRIVHFDDEIELIEVDGATRLNARMSAQPQGLMRLMSPMMARTMRKQFEGNWRYLKAALEASGSEPPHGTGTPGSQV
jgi:carbon monoxide dehydrogenase subunit G